MNYADDFNLASRRTRDLLTRSTGVPLEVLSGVDNSGVEKEYNQRRLLDTLQRLAGDKLASDALRKQAQVLIFYFFDSPQFRRYMDFFRSSNSDEAHFWRNFFQEWNFALI